MLGDDHSVKRAIEFNHDLLLIEFIFMLEDKHDSSVGEFDRIVFIHIL